MLHFIVFDVLDVCGDESRCPENERKEIEPVMTQMSVRGTYKMHFSNLSVAFVI